MEQEIRFCTTFDNVSIAFAVGGSGPPFVKVANWMNHLEYDRQSPVWRHVFDEFSRDHQLVRYDERGTGLSDRNPDDLSLDALVADLESVVDSLGLDRFPLFAISQGGPVALAYAVRHPEKVTHLILHGTFAAGWRKSDLRPQILAKREAQLTLIRQGWGSKNPAFRQMWTTLCIPDAPAGAAESFNELQRSSATAETASRLFEAIAELDVRDLLPKVQVPVIVFHSRDDATVPFEEGRQMASHVHGSKFVPLDSKNHLLLEHEPAWHKFVSEVRNFLGRPLPDRSPQVGTTALKNCPKCGRAYDDQMNYCLDDGTELRSMRDRGADETDPEGQATQILSSERDKGET